MRKGLMGAVIEDVVGSVYEFHSIYTKDFPFLSGRSEFTEMLELHTEKIEASIISFTKRRKR